MLYLVQLKIDLLVSFPSNTKVRETLEVVSEGGNLLYYPGTLSTSVFDETTPYPDGWGPDSFVVAVGNPVTAREVLASQRDIDNKSMEIQHMLRSTPGLREVVEELLKKV